MPCAKAKYRTMTLVSCELVCLNQFLKELKFDENFQMCFICDNQTTLHIKVDYYFIREKLVSGDITS